MKKIQKENKKVFVGLSGGVDSSVTAALLKEAGFQVVGVFIKAWHPKDLPLAQGCTWREERRSAMRVAITLGIPFKTLNLEKEYKKNVVDYMIKEYKKGKTPNPDVMCNKEIKFGSFLDWALKEGADFVATGHYARKREIINSKFETLNKSKNQKSKIKTEYELLEGEDKNKDQSYFLWTLTQKQLKHILFPVGGMQKDKVRKLAKKYNLSTAEKKDSQGVCFLGQVDMKEFLSEYIKTKIGDVLDVEGNVIGHHRGSKLFTVGERHGFTITKKGIRDRPMYVISKNMKKNTIIVSSKEIMLSQNLFVKKVFISNVNWVSGKVPENKNIKCRFRYRQNSIKCKVKSEKWKIWVKFEKLQEFVSSGQSLVFYDRNVCLGGGVIDMVY